MSGNVYEWPTLELMLHMHASSDGKHNKYKPPIFMDSGFSIDSSLDVLRGGGRSRCFDG